MNESIKKLLDHSVEYATELLLETGESYPFGAYLDTVGNVHPLEMEIDTKNVPQIGKVVDVLSKYCQEELDAERMHGYCLSYEVRIQLSESNATDAICFEVIHRDEKNLPKYYLPFTSKRISKKEKEENPSLEDAPQAELGELFAVK